MTDEEYKELLKQRGLQKLEECKRFISFNGTVLVVGGTTYKYKEDFNLGDYVTVIDKDLNLQFDLQITEISKTVTEKGEEKFDIVFGEERATVQELIRRGGMLNG